MSDDKRPECIIFDYGNVIEGRLDDAAFEASLAALADEFGFETGQDLWLHIYVSDAWEQAKRGRITRATFWDDRLRSLGLEDDAAQSAFKARLHAERGLQPGIRDLLEELKARYRLAVLSNTARVDLDRHLREYRGLDGLFEIVISSAAVGMAKPEPEIFMLTLDRLGVTADNALFIDDLERNTLVAESVGISSIVFTGVSALRQELTSRDIL